MTSVVALPPPPSFYFDNNMWLDEQIWGHRLWDSQNPWLIFLEFLSVAEAHAAENHLLDSGDAFPLKFRPAQRIYLRNILYNNVKLTEIANRYSDNATAWTKWNSYMEANAQAVSYRDFSYLQKRFRSFSDFANLVEMIRTATIESTLNKRWSSRFIFPFGAHSIYEDLNISNGSASREYINFGRTGELLYQMLARSRHADALRPHLKTLVSRRDPCDQLIERLQPDLLEDRHERGNSYLPYQEHPAFDALAEDWLAIFELQFPRFDAYPHLATLAALHLSDYQLVVAAGLCGKRRPVYVCEVVAPRKTLVRDLSTYSYLENTQLSQAAIDAYITGIAESEEWTRAAADPHGFPTCREILQKQVWWPPENDPYDGPPDAAALLSSLRRSALARHRQHVANVHRSYAGGAGLVSRRGTNRLRYAPTDDLLKALIFANVTDRMEFGEFLRRLYDRYGLVFGEQEARETLPEESFDKRAFQANSERLENRLKTIGMLRRLSDACAYVENPLGGSAL